MAVKRENAFIDPVTPKKQRTGSICQEDSYSGKDVKVKREGVAPSDVGEWLLNRGREWEPEKGTPAKREARDLGDDYKDEGLRGQVVDTKALVKRSLLLPKNSETKVGKISALPPKFPDTNVLEKDDFKTEVKPYSALPRLEFELKPSTELRDHQAESLATVFRNGETHSGVIVLPCGAGKSLTGVAIAATIKHPTLVLCTNTDSVDQWVEQFKMWSTIRGVDIAKFTSENKGKLTKACVAVTTYQMLTHKNRSIASFAVCNQLIDTNWGLVLLDEVHTVPADSFANLVQSLKTNCKVGLTATPVREDDRIDNLPALIGPTLYEADWRALQENGTLARVQCLVVKCPLTKQFYSDHLRANKTERKIWGVMNPNKFRMCQYLCEMHTAKGVKVIVFSDDVSALRVYAIKLGGPFIDGNVRAGERRVVLTNFVNNPKVSILFMSKVGDTSIDLPETNVLIQIDGQYGQEAQRLGRILRAKKSQNDKAAVGFNAFFYSLLSEDTDEEHHADNRKTFLEDQGYTYQTVLMKNQLAGKDVSKLGLGNPEDLDLWRREVLAAMSTREEKREAIKKKPAPKPTQGTDKPEDKDKKKVPTAGNKKFQKLRKQMNNKKK